MNNYKPYEYTKIYTYKDNIFKFDPTLPVPVEADHEDYGKTLADMYGMTVEEAEAIVLEEKWAQIREYRDAELKATDWVSGTDIPQTLKDLYIPYRQELRDVTTQDNPDDIVLPVHPGAL